MVKTSHFRNTDPALKPREARWAREAHTWVREQALEVFKSVTPGQYMTVGQVMSFLDSRPSESMPQGYVRYIGNYEQRYQIVRAECMRLASDRVLEASSTVNSKGREAVCYRTPQRPMFEILLSGPAADDPRIRSAFESLTRDYDQVFSGLDEILISRVERNASDITPGGGNDNGASTTAQETPTKQTKRRPGRPRKSAPGAA